MFSVTDLVFPTSSETAPPAGGRVLSGELPTGRLHLGHWLGTLRARVALQEAGLETFIVIADHQVDRTRISPRDLRVHVHNLVLDYLASGLASERTVIFAHSQVPALHQLFVTLLSLVDVTELPASRSSSALELTSQVHQAADILAVGATHVPVGLDNEPHVIFAAKLATRFNERYAAALVSPAAVLTPTPTVPGLDGRKMSKSGRNAIALSSSDDETAEAVNRSAVPDGALQDSDLRSPAVLALITLAAQCLDQDPAKRIEEFRPRTGALLKRETAEIINATLAKHRARRRALAAEPAVVAATLVRGAELANTATQATVLDVLHGIGATYTTAATTGPERNAL